MFIIPQESAIQIKIVIVRPLGGCAYVNVETGSDYRSLHKAIKTNPKKGCASMVLG